MDSFFHMRHLRSRQGNFGCFPFKYWQVMKAQTTCSASYVNISLMFISFTENFYFFFSHVCSSLFCPGLNMKCQTTTRKPRHCNIFPAQPAAESLLRQLADFQLKLVEPRCLHNLYKVGLYMHSVVNSNNNQILQVAQPM